MKNLQSSPLNPSHTPLASPQSLASKPLVSKPLASESLTSDSLASEQRLSPPRGTSPPQAMMPADAFTVSAALSAMMDLEEEEFDPDCLEKLGGPKYGKKRWTLGNSASLVEGAASEPLWISIGWIAVPTGLAALMILAMVYA